MRSVQEIIRRIEGAELHVVDHIGVIVDIENRFVAVTLGVPDTQNPILFAGEDHNSPPRPLRKR